MGALSGKVVIVIIACISVVVIATIVIPIVVIYSGRQPTKNPTKVPTTITIHMCRGKKMQQSTIFHVDIYVSGGVEVDID